MTSFRSISSDSNDANLDRFLRKQPLKARASFYAEVKQRIEAEQSDFVLEATLDELLQKQAVEASPGMIFRIRARLHNETKREVRPFLRWATAAAGLAAAVFFAFQGANEQAIESATPELALAEVQTEEGPTNLDTVHLDPQMAQIFALASSLPEGNDWSPEKSGIDTFAALVR